MARGKVCILMFPLLGNVCPSSSDSFSNLLSLLTTTSFSFRYFSREFNCRVISISSLNEFGHFLFGCVPERKIELKEAMSLSHGRKPEVIISRARTVVPPRFSN